LELDDEAAMGGPPIGQAGTVLGTGSLLNMAWPMLTLSFGLLGLLWVGRRLASVGRSRR
jgi:hypothetical protein